MTHWQKQHLTPTQFSHLGRSSYFGLSQNSHVYLHCTKQPMAGQGGNGLGSLSGREQWMTIYGKICSQQDWEAEAAKAEAKWPKCGERPWISRTPSAFLHKDTGSSYKGSKTWWILDRGEITCHCRNAQGLLTGTGSAEWMNGTIDLKPTLQIWFL